MKDPNSLYKNGWLGTVCAVIAACASLTLPSAGQASEAELVMGIFPRRPAVETQQMFQPLADYLSKQIGQPIRLAVPPDFPAFWEAVTSGRYHLIHSNQFHYVRAHHELGHDVIVRNEEFGKNTIQATLWVRRDSGIKSAQDLRGQKVIFGGGAMAMVSHVMATDLLLQAGLKEGDYLKQFAINPTQAMVAMYYRQGSAAGLNRQADRQSKLTSKMNFDELEPLLVSEPVPHHPWSVKPTVSAPLKAKLQQALLSLKDSPDGRRILANAGLTGFSPASDADYDPIRKIIQRATGKLYGSP